MRATDHEACCYVPPYAVCIEIFCCLSLSATKSNNKFHKVKYDQCQKQQDRGVRETLKSLQRLKDCQTSQKS